MSNSTIIILVSDIIFPVFTERLGYLVTFVVGSAIALPCWIYVLYKKYRVTGNVIIV